MSNTIPDEKVTATFIGYLAARLLDLSRYVTSMYDTVNNEKLSIQGDQGCPNHSVGLEKVLCYEEGGASQGEIFLLIMTVGATTFDIFY